jgi:hypothetical protein
MPLASAVAINGNRMEASSLLASVAALAGVGIAVALWRTWRASRLARDPAATASEREERASKLGWRYDGMPNGETLFTLRGESGGVKWKVRYRADSGESDSKKSKLTWATRSVQGATTELRLIGRARYAHSRAHVEPIIEKFSSLIMTPREIGLAHARAEFIERTAPAEVGSPTFRERFVVIARNDRLARSLISEKLEALLIKWGRGLAPSEQVLSIWLDWQGLRIDVDAPWTAMREIEQLVALGLALAGQYRRYAASPGVTRWMEIETDRAR